LTKPNRKQMNGAATTAPLHAENDSFGNAVAQNAPQDTGMDGASCFSARSRCGAYGRY